MRSLFGRLIDVGHRTQAMLQGRYSGRRCNIEHFGGVLAGMVSRAVWGVAGAAVLLEILASGQYGIFRDELYFIACGHHPALGYVDQPPLIPWMAGLLDTLFHGSLVALRLGSALGMGALVIVSALLARALGGDRFAQLLAALCVAIGAEFLTMAHWLITSSFVALLWSAVAYFVVRIINGEDRKLWLWVGVLSGIALLTKYDVIFFEAALCVGILCTPQRTILQSRYLAVAFAIALLMIAPNAWWQWSHGWPMWELLRAGQNGKNISIGASGLLLQQVLLETPVAAPVWMTGIIALIVSDRLRAYRSLGIGFVVLFVAFALLKAKAYYLSPIFPILEAAGAVVIAGTLAARHAWTKPVMIGLLVAGGAIAIPNAIPLLPVQTLISYQSALHFHEAPNEKGEIGALPQHFADEFGWRELAAAFEQASMQLRPAERSNALTLVWNYGEAGAIEYFAGAGVPPVVSGHNNYFLWGLHGRSGDPLLVFGGSEAQHRKYFDEVVRAAYFDHPYAMPYERQSVVWICRHPHRSLASQWHLFKSYE